MSGERLAQENRCPPRQRVPVPKITSSVLTERSGLCQLQAFRSFPDGPWMRKCSFDGQAEEEGGSCLRLGLGPNLTSMPLDHELHDGQSYTGPLKLFGVVKALEHFEEFTRILHAEADAVVAHEVDVAPLLLPGADLHARRGGPARELERVGDQIGE